MLFVTAKKKKEISIFFVHQTRAHVRNTVKLVKLPYSSLSCDNVFVIIWRYILFFLSLKNKININ